VLDNEEQPLVIVSAAINDCKLLIVDEKLFIRCYTKIDNDNIRAFPIRLLITTILCQRAFLEYASKCSVNIVNKKNVTDYANLHRSFVVFMDNFWRHEISNSYFLNKSYRIIGKIWLLNPKFELTKEHLLKNAERERKHKELQFTIALFIIGFLTLTANIPDILRIFNVTENEIHPLSLRLICIVGIICIIGIIPFITPIRILIRRINRKIRLSKMKKK
jgi:hypothetical protein